MLSAVVVFIVSSIIHMVVQFHKSDYKKLPDEDSVLEAMTTGALVIYQRGYSRPSSTYAT